MPATKKLPQQKNNVRKIDLWDDRKHEINVILRRLKEVWEKKPELRLGQLIGNAIDGTKMYYKDDAGLIRTIEECYNRIVKR